MFVHGVPRKEKRLTTQYQWEPQNVGLATPRVFSNRVTSPKHISNRHMHSYMPVNNRRVTATSRQRRVTFKADRMITMEDNPQLHMTGVLASQTEEPRRPLLTHSYSISHRHASTWRAPFLPYI